MLGRIGASALALVVLSAATPPVSAGDIHKIQHVVIIMQENRSFDSYFGTYPGADGIAMQNGVPVACIPSLPGKPCVRPYHDANDENTGGPHSAHAGDVVIDGAKWTALSR